MKMETGISAARPNGTGIAFFRVRTKLPLTLHRMLNRARMGDTTIELVSWATQPHAQKALIAPIVDALLVDCL
jgi:hypothetical protein